MTPRNLDLFFRPRSVAVVGASADSSSVGHAVLANLLYGGVRVPRTAEQRLQGFQGDIFAVNRRGGTILGLEVHESLAAIGRPVDLMMVAIPPRFVPGLMEEAAAVGIGHAIVISAGFAEMGEEGRELRERMLDAARAGGIRIIGPNCLGILRPSLQLNASFAESSPGPGGIGLFSQSGALITGVISAAQRERFGLSAAISLGEKADVEDVEVLRWLAADEATRCVALYVESLPEPEAFLDAAREVVRSKPLVALKGGTTAAGARAASSHTGSLAGSQAAYAAAFAQAGILQATTIGDFVHWARALATQPPAAGPRIAVVTNAGGPGVLAADAAARDGMSLAELSPATFAALDEVLPRVWSRNNPVDVIGDATPDRYAAALSILGRAPEVDGIVLIMTVQAMTDPAGTAAAVAAAAADPSWDKPLVCSFLGLLGSETGSVLDAQGIPELDLPEDAVRAMGALVRRGAWLRREEPPAPAGFDNLPEPDEAAVAAALSRARAAGQENLDLGLARALLAGAGIRYNGSRNVESAEQAVEAAEAIGYPVVLKAISPDVVHKSEVGAIELGVVGAGAVAAACADIRQRVLSHLPQARITGFTVEEQVSGTEIIVGMSRDPDFGPLMMVGMGGIFVEVYGDVAFRPVPLDRRDALDMIGEIRAQALLDGARGRPAADRDELAEIVLRLSRLVEAHPEIAELDVNPLVITERGLVAIDARVIVGGGR